MKEETVSIKILKTTVCDGQDVKKGQVIEASPLDARYLIGIGKAEESTPRKPRRRRAPITAGDDNGDDED